MIIEELKRLHFHYGSYIQLKCIKDLAILLWL